MKEIKSIIAENLSYLRTKHGITQSALAEKLNYTDKAVSKWENGDTVPPIDILKNIADLYDVSLDYLVTEHERGTYDNKYDNKANSVNKVVITLLAALFVWIATTCAYLYYLIFLQQSHWLLFIIATPISFIVLLVFNCIWGKKKLTYVIVSILIWTTLATIYFILLAHNNFWVIFFLGIPFQIAVILWSKLKVTKTPLKKKL